MLDIGLAELLIILVVALIVLGPRRLPEVARKLGRGLAEFRRTSEDLRRSILLDDESAHRPPPFTDAFPKVSENRPAGDAPLPAGDGDSSGADAEPGHPAVDGNPVKEAGKKDGGEEG